MKSVLLNNRYSKLALEIDKFGKSLFYFGTKFVVGWTMILFGIGSVAATGPKKNKPTTETNQCLIWHQFYLTPFQDVFISNLHELRIAKFVSSFTFFSIQCK